MILFKGDTRIFDKPIKEDSTSNMSARVLTIEGVKNYTSIINNIIPIQAYLKGLGTATININSLGAKSLKAYINGSKSELPDNWINTNQIYYICYDGIDFIVSGIELSSDNSLGISYIPKSVLNLTNSSTSDEILTAFDDEDTMKSFISAISTRDIIRITDDIDSDTDIHSKTWIVNYQDYIATPTTVDDVTTYTYVYTISVYLPDENLIRKLSFTQDNTTNLLTSVVVFDIKSDTKPVKILRGIIYPNINPIPDSWMELINDTLEGTVENYIYMYTPISSDSSTNGMSVLYPISLVAFAMTNTETVKSVIVNATIFGNKSNVISQSGDIDITRLYGKYDKNPDGTTFVCSAPIYDTMATMNTVNSVIDTKANSLINTAIDKKIISIPSAVLSLSDTTSSSTITTAFGSSSNISKFITAIKAGVLVVFSNSSANNSIQQNIAYTQYDGTNYIIKYLDLDNKNIKTLTFTASSSSAFSKVVVTNDTLGGSVDVSSKLDFRKLDKSMYSTYTTLLTGDSSSITTNWLQNNIISKDDLKVISKANKGTLNKMLFLDRDYNIPINIQVTIAGMNYFIDFTFLNLNEIVQFRLGGTASSRIVLTSDGLSDTQLTEVYSSLLLKTGTINDINEKLDYYKLESYNITKNDVKVICDNTVDNKNVIYLLDVNGCIVPQNIYCNISTKDVHITLNNIEPDSDYFTHREFQGTCTTNISGKLTDEQLNEIYTSMQSSGTSTGINLINLDTSTFLLVSEQNLTGLATPTTLTRLGSPTNNLILDEGVYYRIELNGIISLDGTSDLLKNVYLSFGDSEPTVKRNYITGSQSGSQVHLFNSDNPYLFRAFTGYSSYAIIDLVYSNGYIKISGKYNGIGNGAAVSLVENIGSLIGPYEDPALSIALNFEDGVSFTQGNLRVYRLPDTSLIS